MSLNHSLPEQAVTVRPTLDSAPASEPATEGCGETVEDVAVQLAMPAENGLFAGFRSWIKKDSSEANSDTADQQTPLPEQEAAGGDPREQHRHSVTPDLSSPKGFSLLGTIQSWFDKPDERKPDRAEVRRARAVVARVVEVLSVAVPEDQQKILAQTLGGRARGGSLPQLSSLIAAAEEFLAERTNRASEAEISEEILGDARNARWLLREMNDFLIRINEGVRVSTGQNLMLGESYELLFKAIEIDAEKLEALTDSLTKVCHAEPPKPESETDRRIARRRHWLGDDIGADALAEELEELSEEKNRVDEKAEEESELADQLATPEAQGELDDGEAFADMVSAGPGGHAEQHAGKVTANELDMYSYLAVHSPRVVTGPDGRVRDVYKWAEDESTGAAEIEGLFREIQVRPLAKGELGYRQGEVHFPVSGSGTIRLPLSPFHTVVEFTAYNSQGEPITGSDTIQIVECVAGSFEVEIAGEDLSEVRYRVEEKGGAWLGNIDEELDKVMPVVRSYAPPAYQSVSSVLGKTNEPLLKKAKILYDFIVERRFYAAEDEQIADLINNSGAARNEVIAALGAANCLPFAYHVALELRKIGVPAFVIGGPIPLEATNNFLVNPGHAQVLVVLPEGLAVFDLTTNVKQDKKVVCSEVSSIEWEKTREGFKTQTRKEVYQKVRSIRDQILTSGSTGQVNASAASGSESSGRSRYQEGTGSMSSLGGSGWGSSRQQADPALVDDLSNDPEVRAIQKGLQVRSYFELMTALVRQAKIDGNLQPVIDYVRNEEEPPVLHREELRFIGDSYSKLVYLTPEKVLEQTAKEFLVDQSVSSELRTQAADLLGSETTASAILNVSTSGVPGENSRMYRSSEEFKLDRLIDEAPENIFLQSLSDSMLVRITRSSAQELICNFSSDSSRQNFPLQKLAGNHIGGPQRIGYPNSVERKIGNLQKLAAELKRRNKDPLHGDCRDLAAMVGTLAVDMKHRGFWDNKANEQELEERTVVAAAALTTTAVSLLEIGTGLPDDNIFAIIHGTEDTWRRGMAAFCTEILDEVLFTEDTRPTNEAMSARLAGEVLNAQSIGDIERSIRRLTEANFQIALDDWQEKIEEQVCELVEKHFTARGVAEINYPTEEFPASCIEAAAANRGDAELYRSVNALYQAGGLSSLNRVQRIWPAVDEAEVASRLVRALSCGDEYSTSTELLLYHGSFDGAQFAIDEFPALLEVGLKGRPISLSVLRALENMNVFTNSIAGSFEKLRDQFPDQWEIITEQVLPEVQEHDEHHEQSTKLRRRDSCAKAIIARLFDGITQQDLYPALIGMAAARVLPNPDGADHIYSLEWDQREELIHKADAPLVDFCIEMAGMSPEDLNSDQKLKHFIDEHAPEQLRSSRFFWNAPLEVQRAALFGTLLSKELAEDSRGEGLGYAAGFYYEEFRGFGEVVLDTGRSSEGTIWNDAFGKGTSTSFNIWGILPKLRAEAERVHWAMGQRSSRPFARFLAQQTGRVTVRATSGDFESFRAYVPGDDRRLVDQKVLGRTGKLYVKQFTEREEPPIVFLVDAEFLIEGYAERPRSESYGAESLQDNLADFYRCMFMAHMNGVIPHLRINARGFNQERYDQEGVRRILTPMEIPRDPDEDRYYSLSDYRTTDEQFLYERLCACLTAEGLEKLETRLYGKEGFHSFGVLEGNDTDFPSGADVLAFIHPRNIPASLPQLARLNGGRDVRIWGMNHGAVNARR